MSDATPAGVAAALAAKRRPAEAVLDHVPAEGDVIVGLGNAGPSTLLDAIEAHDGRLRDVRLHQFFPRETRAYMEGKVEGLRHVSWFLSPFDRPAYHAGTCDLVPNNFADVPRLMERSTTCSLVIVSVAPPDRHGYFSLGLHAEYVAAFIGRMPFFLEVNHRMPRTFGENQIHVSQVEGWCEADYPLLELPPPQPHEADSRIAAHVVERIPDEACLQVGVGSIPSEVLRGLRDHRNLGYQSELLPEGVIDLVEAGALTGTAKPVHANKMIATTALGTQRLYDFVDENPGVEFWPVDYTNDAANIARQRRMVAINATLEIDFLGQCASESLGSDYWSSTGGQSDFARGAILAEEGQSFIVLRSTTGDRRTSRIVSQLHPAAAVSTHKNVVDKVVTEHGVAELRGASIRERTRRLIAIADPAFRESLEREARELGYL